MKLPEKGSFGYFDKKKKITLTAAIVSFLIVAAIYAAGIFTYHTNKSVFTVIAALSVLPAAKIFVSFLVIARCHSLSIEKKEELCALTANLKECRILYDILLASEEKPLAAGTVVILGGHILLYSDVQKTDAQAVENYIKKILEGCPYTSVKMYTNFEQMKNQIRQNKNGQKDNIQKDNIQQENIQKGNNCEHIEKRILIYTI